MLDALVAGTTDPDVLAELARGQLRKKIPALREALEGRFDAAPRAADRRDPRPPRLPRRADRAALGRDRGAARALSHRRLSCCARSPASSAAPPRCIIAEIGADMTRLPDRRAPRLLGRPVPRQRPIRRQTPLRHAPARAPSGSDFALEEAALAAIRTKDTYLAAQYQRLKPAAATNARSAPSSTRS